MCNILPIGPKVGTQDLPLSGLQWWELYSQERRDLLVAFVKFNGIE
jgi:hypothetical protein